MVHRGHTGGEFVVCCTRQDAALHAEGEQLFFLQQGSGLWSRNNSLLSSLVVPAVGEVGHVQVSSIKQSVEAQLEDLTEEFRQACKDAEENMPAIIELYKSKMRTLLDEVSH